jgi:transaldolase/glucose-6-phosphate isomerase
LKKTHPPPHPLTPGTETATIVERIWNRDAALWTGADEDRWLGWLDAPLADPPTVPGLEFDDCVLLGMGGSSLAPEVMRRAVGASRFHVLDTTHPDAIRALEARIEPDRTLFVAASKSGTTLETRCHVEYFWREGRMFAAVTDPGSELEQLARERAFAAVVPGEPTIGGRYSALSPFGLVPAGLMGLDVEALLGRAREMREACRSEADNPGLDLGLALGNGWREGRDKVVVPDAGGFGLWLEQLLAESTGKEGKGLVPAPGESPDGPDRQSHDVDLGDPLELGGEFYRWEFATAVAGAIMEINPFDQPNVQEAKDRTGQILKSGAEPDLEPVASLDELLGQVEPGNYFCVQAFVEPTEEAEARIDRLCERVRSELGLVTTAGFGPRYLHSTGQLHKGGPASGLFLQVVDDPEELSIPGSPFGFRRLIRAQAAGDFEALRERGRRVARIRWEEIA